jgi:homoserine kinase
MIVRVPGSSANLGPGFDTLGMAVALHAEVAVVGDPGAVPEGGQLADDHHPATVAFRRAGGHGALWVRTSLPAGRGLGFSGAVRLAGIVSAHVQQHGPDPAALAGRHGEVLALATELEGHADNVAASLLGGVTATAAGRAVRIPMAIDAVLVLWVPSFTTRTEQSRGRLAAQVPFADAVFNVAHVALLVGALASGDRAALRVAVADRLHQDARLASAAPSRAALDAALDQGALCAWLSGSGPTIAALCDPADAERIAAGLPDGGRARVVQIDHAGTTIVP